MKTPEEMAEEYLNKNYELDPHFPADVQGDKLPDRQTARPAFLAGYKAAQEQVLARFKSLLSSFAETSFNPNHTAWQIFDTLNENQAAQDQLADADKVMPQWISVNDRLPEIDKYVLITRRTSQDYTNLKVMEACRISDEEYEIWGDHVILADYVDYWMPLPKPPEDE